MISYYFHLELKRTKEEEEQRLNLLMREIRSMMDSKKQRSKLQKLKNIQPKTQPNGWDYTN